VHYPFLQQVDSWLYQSYFPETKEKEKLLYNTAKVLKKLRKIYFSETKKQKIKINKYKTFIKVLFSIFI
jgi:hypothetical protein